MKVYHGTSSKNLKTILKNGLKPRGKSKGNWDSFPSRNDMVYLTTAYAPYFAISSCKKMEKALVLEIDLDVLDRTDLYPDEDFVAQVLAHQQNSSIEDVHDYVRDNLEHFQHCFEDSLNGLGNISHKGIVSPSAVSRYCLIDIKSRSDLGMMCLDPSISIMNYRFCGNRYRSIISWLFGDRDDFELGITGDNKEWIEMIERNTPGYRDQTVKLFSNRQGIEVARAA